MKKLFVLVFSILSLQFSNSSLAQSKKNLRDSTTVIIFNQSSSEKKKHKKSGEDNIIKIAPLGFVSGTFPVLYERSLTEYLGLQVGIGLTNKNYFRTATTQDADNIKYTYPAPYENTYDDVSEHIYKFNYRQVKMGYMLSVQPRLYFESDGLEGSFLGLSLDYYRYNFQIPGIVADGINSYKQTGSMKDENENIQDFMVHFGNQALNDKISIEWTTALGIRNVSGNKYFATQSGFEGISTYKQTVFNFNIGFKVGYHF